MLRHGSPLHCGQSQVTTAAPDVHVHWLAPTLECEYVEMTRTYDEQNHRQKITIQMAFAFVLKSGSIRTIATARPAAVLVP